MVNRDYLLGDKDVVELHRGNLCARCEGFANSDASKASAAAIRPRPVNSPTPASGSYPE